MVVTSEHGERCRFLLVTTLFGNILAVVSPCRQHYEIIGRQHHAPPLNNALGSRVLTTVTSRRHRNTDTDRKRGTESEMDMYSMREDRRPSRACAVIGLVSQARVDHLP